MSMPSKDERMRMRHMRIENENQYLRRKKALEMDLGDKFTNLSKQEQLIKKQQLRLENEKTFNKSHSNLTKDRKLSLHGQESSEALQSQQPNLPEVRSKLFDYQKSSPRSRRQLIESGKTTPATPATPMSPTPRVLATHAIEANKASHKDIVNHLTLKSDKPSKRDLSREPSKSTIDKTVLERQGSRRTLPQPEHKELERQSSRRTLPQPEHKVSFNDYDKLHTPKLDKAKSTEHTGKTKTKYPRRKSEPVPNIHVTEVEGAGKHENEVKLQHLYNKAIETVKQVDESLMRGPHQKTRNSKDKLLPDHKHTSGFDINALKELEHILNDARIYTSRKSSKEDHHRLDLGSNRAQKKRIEHLEQVIKQLNPKYGDSSNEIDPLEVLQCSYLRLSKSNIATLEEMVRDTGKDPGIHIHSDVTDYNIWDNIQNERKDVDKSPKLSPRGK